MPLGWTRRGFVLSEAEGWAISLEGELEANKWTQVKKKKTWKMENGKMNFKILVFLIQLCLIPPPVHVPGQSPQARKDDKRKSNNPPKWRRSKQVAAAGSLDSRVRILVVGLGRRYTHSRCRPAAAGPSWAFQREPRIAPNPIERLIDEFK